MYVPRTDSLYVRASRSVLVRRDSRRVTGERKASALWGVPGLRWPHTGHPDPAAVVAGPVPRMGQERAREMRGTRESRLASDLIDGETAGSQEVPGDFESKTRQILHQGNAQPLVRDVPEVVHRTPRGAGKVLSAKRLAIGLRHEVHHAEQGRSETRRMDRQRAETGSERGDLLKDVVKLVRPGQDGNARLGQLAAVGIDQDQDLRSGIPLAQALDEIGGGAHGRATVVDHH